MDYTYLENIEKGLKAWLKEYRYVILTGLDFSRILCSSYFLAVTRKSSFTTGATAATPKRYAEFFTILGFFGLYMFLFVDCGGYRGIGPGLVLRTD